MYVQLRIACSPAYYPTISMWVVYYLSCAQSLIRFSRINLIHFTNSFNLSFFISILSVFCFLTFTIRFTLIDLEKNVCYSLWAGFLKFGHCGPFVTFVTVHLLCTSVKKPNNKHVQRRKIFFFWMSLRSKQRQYKRSWLSWWCFAPRRITPWTSTSKNF